MVLSIKQQQIINEKFDNVDTHTIYMFRGFGATTALMYKVLADSKNNSIVLCNGTGYINRVKLRIKELCESFYLNESDYKFHISASECWIEHKVSNNTTRFIVYTPDTFDIGLRGVKCDKLYADNVKLSGKDLELLPYVVSKQYMQIKGIDLIRKVCGIDE